MNKILAALLALFCIGLAGLNAAPGKITGIRASASSEFKQYKAANAVDGKISNESRWLSTSTDVENRLMLEWDEVQMVQGVHLFSGWGGEDSIRGLEMHFRDAAGKWIAIRSAGSRKSP